MTIKERYIDFIIKDIFSKSKKVDDVWDKEKGLICGAVYFPFSRVSFDGLEKNDTDYIYAASSFGHFRRYLKEKHGIDSRKDRIDIFIKLCKYTLSNLHTLPNSDSVKEQDRLINYYINLR